MLCKHVTSDPRPQRVKSKRHVVYYVLTCLRVNVCFRAAVVVSLTLNENCVVFVKFTVPQSASELSLFLFFSLGKCYRDFLSRGVFLKCDAGLLEIGLHVNGS